MGEKQTKQAIIATGIILLLVGVTFFYLALTTDNIQTQNYAKAVKLTDPPADGHSGYYFFGELDSPFIAQPNDDITLTYYSSNGNGDVILCLLDNSTGTLLTHTNTTTTYRNILGVPLTLNFGIESGYTNFGAVTIAVTHYERPHLTFLCLGIAFVVAAAAAIAIGIAKFRANPKNQAATSN
jgi:hypothetical protein